MTDKAIKKRELERDRLKQLEEEREERVRKEREADEKRREEERCVAFVIALGVLAQARYICCQFLGSGLLDSNVFF